MEDQRTQGREAVDPVGPARPDGQPASRARPRCKGKPELGAGNRTGYCCLLCRSSHALKVLTGKERIPRDKIVGRFVSSGCPLPNPLTCVSASTRRAVSSSILCFALAISCSRPLVPAPNSACRRAPSKYLGGRKSKGFSRP